MIEITLKLILFFLISLIYFYSLTGFGKILANNKSNFFDLYIDGTIILLILSYFLYISVGINHIFNIIILVTGLLLFFFL